MLRAIVKNLNNGCERTAKIYFNSETREYVADCVDGLLLPEEFVIVEQVKTADVYDNMRAKS